ncbi:MAG: ABC transporter permease [Oscillospiraceae bacterium]|jgi:peptide/nickel transport system permease protein|nr:ABC transporter permease [Oscillospiraceae bacterium]
MDPNQENQHMSASVALDDEQRIRVLSPGMLVFKRFVRNKLAITGAVIVIFMFAFSFIGGLVNPHGQTEVFRHYQPFVKEYAAAAFTDQYRFTPVPGRTLSQNTQNAFNVAAARNAESFSADGETFMIEVMGEDFYLIEELVPFAKVTSVRGQLVASPLDGHTIPDGFTSAIDSAIKAGRELFEAGGDKYAYIIDGREYAVFTGTPVCVVVKKVFDLPPDSPALSYHFVMNAMLAFQGGDPSFEAEGQTYTFDRNDGGAEIYGQDGLVAVMSPLAIKEYQPGEVMTLEFKAAVAEAIAEGTRYFELIEDGEVVEYTLEDQPNQWVIRKEMDTYLIKTYGPPSLEHWLGTDANGMDVLTRLMYGGRISITIGFVVVLIEMFIGIILGGIAGYFGKWVDNLIMRIVDIFNCIPTFPLYIILGASLDQFGVDPTLRIYYLMLIIGLLGWPGIARMVRGQILSLREQEFMVAAEATGLRVPRRIFRHLIPNVIPQLIVISTMTLGGIIITEATLSFLGLGVRYPLASWGNMVTNVNDPYIMITYLNTWVPAGMLILITVLGFNFIGDGLRDAFDPKMKR